MSLLTLHGPLDAGFGWANGQLLDPACSAPGAPAPWSRGSWRLRGAWASCALEGTRARLIRDPLGLGKLFWAHDADGGLHVAARPSALIDAGCDYSAVYAMPRGQVWDLDAATGTVVVQQLAAVTPPEAPLSPEAAGAAIRAELERFLAALHARYADAQVYVCVSGGLDSSGIAALVHERWPDATAVSFDLKRAGPPSADRRTGRRLAGDLGMDLLEADAHPDDLLDMLDTVLIHGVDWRDFNVHAGLVNAALAVAIDQDRGRGGQLRECLVFTGDLANELLADYAVEQYADREYYALPRLPILQLRAALVQGLDTSHREIGVFGAWDLPVVQPYAVAADAYLALPAAALTGTDAKRRLDREIFGDLIPDYIYDRPKTRAQVGDAATGTGVLAACADRGLDARALLARFAALHDCTPEVARQLMRAGRYRAKTPQLTTPR